MVGSTLPDLTRIGLILDPAMMESVMPFSWSPLHTPIGGMMVVGILSMLMENKHQYFGE